MSKFSEATTRTAASIPVAAQAFVMGVEMDGTPDTFRISAPELATLLGVSDGDKGHIVVSSSGTVWNIDTAARPTMAGVALTRNPINSSVANTHILDVWQAASGSTALRIEVEGAVTGEESGNLINATYDNGARFRVASDGTVYGGQAASPANTLNIGSVVNCQYGDLSVGFPGAVNAGISDNYLALNANGIVGFSNLFPVDEPTLTELRNSVDVTLSRDASTRLSVKTSNVERLRVGSDGIRIGNAYTLPLTDGTSNQILKTDGAGVVTWQADATGGGGVADGDKGDITVSASGATWTIDNLAVSYAKIQNVSATDRLLGRSTAGAGVIEEITCTAFARTLLDDADAAAARTTLGFGTADVTTFGLDMLAAVDAAAGRTVLGLGTLATQSGTFSGTSSGTNTGDQTITLTGDVTGSGTGSFAATIAADAVTYAKIQDVTATDRLLGRSTAGAGVIEEITCTAAGRAILDDADASAQRTTLGVGAAQNPTFANTTAVVFTITDGVSVDINPANGGIQVWTLGANRTPTASSFAAGQSVTLMIDDGTAFAVTWSTIGVVWVGGSAPTLPTSGYGVIELWKVASTVYGAYVGAVA